MHTATIVAYQGKKVMIDCGESWAGRISELKPRAIVITHPHPDHAFGLKDGAPCSVYATAAAWKRMKNFLIPTQLRKVLQPRKPTRIAGITFEAFPVMHSVLAPAVGYRISVGKVAFFYVPDVARIPNRTRAFSGIRAYIGDGATLARPLVRREKQYGRLIGHASIDAQLGWCKKEGVQRVIITHCGSAIVGSDEERTGAKLQRLAQKHGLKIQIARDGMELVLH
jgi:phosphoribosyl 1,2-cyclic phosphodiesterase